MVTVSAPAKMHLIGEHAVVYGHPAILAAVGLRTVCEFRKADKIDEIDYTDERWNDHDEWSVENVLSKTDEACSLWNQCNEKKNFSELFAFGKSDNYRNWRKSILGTVMNALDIRSGFAVKISSAIPVGSGLGSSSSLAVCFAKGLSELFSKPLPVEEVNRIAFECEKLCHGTPSGGDNSACAYGGLIQFVKGQPPVIQSLRKEIPHRLEGFFLVYTGAPEKTTGELVQLVRDHPLRDQKMSEIGAMVKEMKFALASRDYARMKQIINATQDCLAAVGVSTPKIDSLVSSVRSIGGAAKLCGAGGGGIVLCWHEDSEKLGQLLVSSGYEPLQADLGVEGVRID